MKRNKIFSFLAAGVTFAFIACNNSGSNTSSTDTTSNSNTITSTRMSNGNYAARADSVRTNVKAGYYLNPRTGRPYSNLTVDTTTGALTDESGKPVKRYVDKRTWWVYDANTWDTVGSARLQGNDLMYRADNGNWVTYDKRWSDDMDNGTTNSTITNDTSSSTNNTSTKSNTKVKVSDNGDKIKIKKKSKE